MYIDSRDLIAELKAAQLDRHAMNIVKSEDIADILPVQRVLELGFVCGICWMDPDPMLPQATALLAEYPNIKPLIVLRLGHHLACGE